MVARQHEEPASRRVLRRVLLVVTDGLGYDPAKVEALTDEVWRRADDSLKRIAHAMAVGLDPPMPILDDVAVKLILTPRWSELPGIGDNRVVARRVESVAEDVALDHAPGSEVIDDLQRLWHELGREHRYVPWAAEVTEWSQVVNANLTFPTAASGVWVGYEDLDPPVQGNSETGHQQLGNFGLAPQIPLEITQSISSGAFFENAALNAAIDHAVAADGRVVVCFLLSGISGSEGRVHSAWNHLEAMLELLFARRGLAPAQVRLQAILDGRDAPAHASLELAGVEGGYLGELERLLARYGATRSLAWVIGRSIAMDRDYREECAAKTYQLLVNGDGSPAGGFGDVRELVQEFHRGGGTDADVPPIVVADADGGVPTLGRGDAFVNLNFRSDRQRVTTAWLVGATDYLRREASARDRAWSFDWLGGDLGVHVCAIAEYDAAFESDYGVAVAYPTTPHALNLLATWRRLMPPGSRYLLVAESVKASHMGYFVRGRREQPTDADAEERWITPSASAADSVVSDSDFWKVPAMRTEAIVGRVSQAMAAGEHALIVCNLAAPDMVGHLLPTRFEEAVAAYRATVEGLARLHHAAQQAGYSMVVTSDHGNVEQDSPTHTANPVLTTIIPAPGVELEVAEDGPDATARLFDVPHCVAELLGIDSGIVSEVIESAGGGEMEPRFVGRSLVRRLR